MWVALEKKVSLVIWGEPSAEYSSFYGYDQDEEVDERRFNTVVNLVINAEDMLGMLDNTVSGYTVTVTDLKPFTYPPFADLRALKMRSICLGTYIPWDVKTQVQLIKAELGWQGAEVEGVPPEYDYEKIECFMQGVRDYIKFLLVATPVARVHARSDPALPHVRQPLGDCRAPDQRMRRAQEHTRHERHVAPGELLRRSHRVRGQLAAGAAGLG